MYVIDSDVFISAKNAYYAFDICPGFWESIIDHYHANRVCSIDHIRQELLAGNSKEDLVQWVKKMVPDDFFVSSQDAGVMGAYGQIMLWVQRDTQYTDAAKAKFATEADGWLVAHGMVHGIEVATNEQPRPEARSRILLPDVCDQFGVPYHNTFEMLRTLGARYHY